MPFNKEQLAGMTANYDEYVNKAQIAERFGISVQTVDSVIEHAKRNASHLRLRSRKEYLWEDIIKCARSYAGVKKKSEVTEANLIAKLFLDKTSELLGEAMLNKLGGSDIVDLLDEKLATLAKPR